MGRLTKQLAQEIVQRTMGVIHHNVNVMDETGTIIGSGNISRLGLKHEGAMIAIERRGRFEVDDALAVTLHGVLPGTNLVIEFQNEVVGAIGITGDPQEVTKYGELVKMTAELYLEQAYLLEQAQWDKRLKEDFLLSIIHGDRRDSGTLREQAKRIGLDPAIPRTSVIIELVESDEERGFETLKSVVDLLEKRDTVDAIVMRNSRQIVLLKRRTDERSEDGLCEGIRSIIGLLRKKQIGPVRIAIGKTYTGLPGLLSGYASARDTLRAGKAIFPERDVFYYEDLQNETLLASLGTNWKSVELKELYGTLLHADKTGELRQTLRVYFAESGELAAVAEKLSVHRNTLRYRLQRIQEITGKDPRNLSDLYSLISGMWLHAYQELGEDR